MATFKQRFLEAVKNSKPDVSPVSHYFFTDAKNNQDICQFNDICFARLRTASGKGIKNLRIYVNQHKNDKIFNDEISSLIVSNIGKVIKLFPDAFLNKTKDWINEGIAFNCNMSHQQVFYIATCIRMMYEFQRDFGYSERVKDLEEYGFTFFQAMTLAQWIRKNNNGKHYSIVAANNHGVNNDNTKLGSLVSDPIKTLTGDPLNTKSSSFYGVMDKLIGNKGEYIGTTLKEGSTHHGKGWESKLVITEEQLYKNLDTIKKFIQENQNA